ncbi:hypothetical protein, partial [Xanthomonas populi]|uniref:hypothetical protein n=1 Tax=Xanthomonas populi TaxID=53414 RepID=UPI001ABF7E23
ADFLKVWSSSSACHHGYDLVVRGALLRNRSVGTAYILHNAHPSTRAMPTKAISQTQISATLNTRFTARSLTQARADDLLLCVRRFVSAHIATDSTMRFVRVFCHW